MREETVTELNSLSQLEQMSQFYIGRKIWGDVIISKEFVEDSEYQSRLYYTNVHTKEAHKFASLLMVHGYGEHSTRYLEAALQFANANYEVHLFDFRGFGYSSGARFMTSLDEFYEDILLILTKIYKNNSLFVFAHSMGAGLFLSFLKMNPNLKIAGLMCSNPFIDMKQEPMSFLEKQIIKRLPRSFDVCLSEVRHQHRLRRAFAHQGQFIHKTDLRRSVIGAARNGQSCEVFTRAGDDARPKVGRDGDKLPHFVYLQRKRQSRPDPVLDAVF